MKEPILETERFILRPLTVDDAEAVFAWAGDERVAKFMGYTCHENIEVTKAWLSSLKDSPENHFDWGFVLKENNRLIGSGGIYWSEENNAWNLGYNMAFDYWGNGYTTEITKRMIKFAYENLGARDFVAYHAVDNPASGRVMEKCGMKFSHFGEYSKIDGSVTFKTKVYKLHLE